MTREVMQGVWALFDALGPTEMLGAYLEASREYLEVESETPDSAGEQDVDGFAGKRPLAAYQLSRTWELACHSWDIYVARDRSARLDPAAVALLAEGMPLINLPLDKERGAALPGVGAADCVHAHRLSADVHAGSWRRAAARGARRCRRG